MEFEELLAGVEQVLFACGTQYVSGDYELADSILSELERCSGMLSSYISSLLYLEQEQPPELEVGYLRDLHRCVDQLQVLWQSKMMHLEGLTAGTERGGRPLKRINIELVWSRERDCDGHGS